MSLAYFCGKCGALQNSSDAFCRTCGASLAHPQTSSSTGQPYPGTGRQSSLLTGQQFLGTRQQPSPSTGQPYPGTGQQPFPSTGQPYPGTGGQQPFPSTGQPYPGTGRQPPGKILHGRYRLIQIIGQGGMGAVYIAHDLQLGNRLVALKEMSMSRLEPQEVPRAIQQFQQEAYLLASLQHPNLPTIYEYFSEDGRWYLAMTYINGQSLQSCLDQAPGHKFAVTEAVRIGIELCTVLNYLHTHTPQIIFRDLKPLNILMTSTGQIYLIDFGIARHFKADQTRDTSYYYSVGYAAPEQYGTSQTSARSDIYSLGATLHQMLSGLHPANRPFHFAPLNMLDPTIPEPLAKLVAKMVEMDEESRPASVALVKQEMEKVLAPPPEPPQDVRTETETKPPDKKKGLFGREKTRKSDGKKEAAPLHVAEKEPVRDEQVGTPQPSNQLPFPDQQGRKSETEKEQPSPLRDQILPSATSSDAALSPRGQNTGPSGTPTPQPSKKRAKRRLSPVVVAIIMIGIIALVIGVLYQGLVFGYHPARATAGIAGGVILLIIGLAWMLVTRSRSRAKR
ncbi:MAG TPA: protein kinase [Ktedonobacteraceae bacterium]|nr:protein kinase [Ktedonobacteraceae bacterium]